jgi:hypothetical protein
MRVSGMRTYVLTTGLTFFVLARAMLRNCSPTVPPSLLSQSRLLHPACRRCDRLGFLVRTLFAALIFA